MNEMIEYTQLINELNDLNQQLNEIINKIDLLYEKLEPFSNNQLTNINVSTNKQIWKQKRELFSKRLVLEEKIQSIKDKIFLFTPPIKSNGLIELRKMIDGRNDNPNDITGNYSICLANKKEVVGEITYRGYHFDEYIGDIGYTIDIKYRGNNYAYYALCLLGELLRENGIDNFWISTYKDNIPSVKTIEKYGGVPIKGEFPVKYSCLYMAKTFINDKQVEGKRTLQ